MNTVRTRELEIGYRERGPRDGIPVLFVHGFPDDARTWDHVAETLAARGVRALAPYLRGFGPTRYRGDAERTGEITAHVCDVLAFADALGLETFHCVGHDWGARACYGVAALWPERVRSLVALAVAYGTTTPDQTLSFAQSRAFWYQWYFATARGAAELESNREAFCRDLWRTWSPGWRFDDAEYDATAASFANPDFVAVALSSYRQRWGFAPGARTYERERAALAATPRIRVPTRVLMGADDGASLPSSAEGKEALFDAPYRSEIVPECGHFVQREHPALVAERVAEHVRAYDTGS